MNSGGEFGALLRYLRLRANLGLRRFAEAIGEYPSNVSAIETGKRPPWRMEEKLRNCAAVLGVAEGTDDWQRFFDAARNPETPPADIRNIMKRAPVPSLLRTVDEMQLSDDQVRRLVDFIKAEFLKNDSKDNPDI